jgi:hypothetical protein
MFSFMRMLNSIASLAISRVVASFKDIEVFLRQSEITFVVRKFSVFQFGLIANRVFLQ